MLIPVKVEIQSFNRPYSNYALIAFITFFFLLTMFQESGFLFDNLVLKNWNPAGIVGSIFLHGDFMHLFFNMLFLYVFGNAICNSVGNILYVPVFILLGICGSLLHLIADGNPAVGASGAISGLIGLAMVWFPKSKVKFYYYFYFHFGSFSVFTLIVALFYLLSYFFGLFFSGGGIAHYAHIGGFLGGTAFGLFMLLMNKVAPDQDTLLDVISGKSKKRKRSLEKNIQKAHLSKDDYKSYGQGILNNYEIQMMNELNKEYDAFAVPVESVPKFRILRVIETTENIKCFAVNEGDSILNISISENDGRCSLLPEDKFLQNSSGVFNFKKEFFENGRIIFGLYYTNSSHFGSRKIFIFDKEKKEIYEETEKPVINS